MALSEMRNAHNIMIAPCAAASKTAGVKRGHAALGNPGAVF